MTKKGYHKYAKWTCLTSPFRTNVRREVRRLLIKWFLSITANMTPIIATHSHKISFYPCIRRNFQLLRAKIAIRLFSSEEVMKTYIAFLQDTRSFVWIVVGCVLTQVANEVFFGECFPCQNFPCPFLPSFLLGTQNKGTHILLEDKFLLSFDIFFCNNE